MTQESNANVHCSLCGKVVPRADSVVKVYSASKGGRLYYKEFCFCSTAHHAEWYAEKTGVNK